MFIDLLNVFAWIFVIGLGLGLILALLGGIGALVVRVVQALAPLFPFIALILSGGFLAVMMEKEPAVGIPLTGVALVIFIIYQIWRARGADLFWRRMKLLVPAISIGRSIKKEQERISIDLECKSRERVSEKRQHDKQQALLTKYMRSVERTVREVESRFRDYPDVQWTYRPDFVEVRLPPHGFSILIKVGLNLNRRPIFTVEQGAHSQVVHELRAVKKLLRRRVRNAIVESSVKVV